MVGWAELPTAGNELHHFGWNACSSALCHPGHGDHGQPLERRYLILPGLRSSRTYVLDTQPDPASPASSGPSRLTSWPPKAGYSRPHTVHCGPGGIYLSNLGGANGHDGPGGVALLDHDSFEVVGAWEHDRGDQWFGYDAWWHLNYDTMITSEWGTPSMIEQGLNPDDLLGRKFGHHLFYPGGVGAWLAKLDTNPTSGGLAADPGFFPHGDTFHGLRVHQTRLQGGDASSDSYCHTH